MSGNHDDGHHAEHSRASLRARALESLLVEKGLTTSDLVDQVISLYESDIGPRNGARVVARAWTDPAYKQRLLADGSAAIAELGFGGVLLSVVENTPSVHNLVVCTLCSCYPGNFLGSPPIWYSPGGAGNAAGRTAVRAVSCPRRLPLATRPPRSETTPGVATTPGVVC